MRSPLARGLVALGAVAALVILFVVLSGDDDNGGGSTTQTQVATGATGATGQENQAPAEPATKRIVIVNGKPQGGVQKLEYKKGSPPPVRQPFRREERPERHKCEEHPAKQAYIPRVGGSSLW